MKLKAEVTDRKGNTEVHDIRCGYLVKFVNPDKEYPVSYTIENDGTKDHKPTILKGMDLTEPQIVELFINEML